MTTENEKEKNDDDKNDNNDDDDDHDENSNSACILLLGVLTVLFGAIVAFCSKHRTLKPQNDVYTADAAA